MAKLAKTPKITKTVNVKTGKIKVKVEKAPTKTLNEAFMAQVDVALTNAYKLYEKRELSREVIQAIANSVLK